MKNSALMKMVLAVNLLALAVIPPALFAQEMKVDTALKEYQQVSGVTGNLNSIGSDTLNNLMTFWAEAFKAIYPNVNIQVEGKGSATAPPALIEGTAQLGPMSRVMKAEEIDQFEKKYGYKPTPVKVAVDAIGVFVHKDNPLENITMSEVDGIFSSTLKQGGNSIESWGAVLGPRRGWTNRAISIYGRNSASGTYAFFKEVALKKGDYRPTVKEQPGSSGVLQAVAHDLGGIGYSGIGYLTSGVRAVKLNGVEPTMENALNGKYKLGRYLYVYVNKKPGEPFDTLTLEFLKMVLSKKGQEVVVKDGYFPLPSKMTEEELKRLSENR